MLFCVIKFQEGKIIKKTLNIILVTVALVSMMLAVLYFTFQTRYVQQIVISKLTSGISESIDADVSIGRVNLILFRKLVLNDVYISDQQKDTLLYTQKLIASIDSLSFKEKNVHFKSISLIKPNLKINRDKDGNFNFDFLLSHDTTNVNKNKWNIHCFRVELKNGSFNYSDRQLKTEFQKLLQIHKIDLILDDLKLASSDNYSFDIKKLRLSSKNEFEIKSLTTSFEYKDSTYIINKLVGATAYSKLKVDSLSIDLKKYFRSNNPYDIKIDLLVNKFNLNHRDMAYLFPEYSCEGLDFGMSGRLYGKISEIKGKGVKAKVGEITNLNGDFYLNGLPDIENTYIFVNLFESYANLNELRKLNLPEKLQVVKTKLPKFLDNVGTFSYRGNFTGFLNDFVAYGTAYSNLGSIESDVSIKPRENKGLIIKGHVGTQNLNVGALIKTENIEKLSMKGELDGTIDYSNYNLTFNGIVDTIFINRYRFQKIDIKGNLKNKLFDGNLSINDPNLKLKFFGNLDLSPALPVFKFVANVDYADLYKLNLSKDKISKIGCSIDANFQGNNIDNLIGSLEIDSLNYRNSFDSFALQKAIINNTKSGNTSYLSLKSDWADAKISGQYSFMTITNSLIKFYQHYLPSSISKAGVSEGGENNFSFQVLVKSPDPITRVFFPGLVLKPPFNIEGFYNAGEQTARFETTIPSLQYSSQIAENVTIKMDAKPNAFLCHVKTEKTHLAKNADLSNVLIEAIGKNDQLDVNLIWNNNEERTYSGAIKTSTTFTKSDTKYPHILINIDSSKIYVADSLWNLASSTIKIDSTTIEVSNFSVANKDQRILIDGKISKDEKAIASAEIQNIDINMITPIFNLNNFNGIVNGKINIADVYEKLKLNMDLSIKDFAFQNALFGDVEVRSNWKSDSEKLETYISLKDKKQTVVDGFGSIDPKNKYLDMNVVLAQAPISFLDAMLPFLFYDSQGRINGRLRILGPFSHLSFNGELKPDSKVGLGISSLRTHYYFSDPVHFHSDSMIFSSIHVEDELKNTGILKGSIVHQNFDNLKYDLTISSNKILAMNTTSADNESFYGTIVGSGVFTITGKENEILLKGDVRSEKGTNIFIPYVTKEEAEKYDFIKFVNEEKIENKAITYQPVSSGLTMNFDVEVTPDAKAQIIFNSQMGDIIKGEGNGNLQVKIDKYYNIEMYGECVVEKGEYLFTLENIINKKFLINRGGTIKWTGDPYNAQVDLTAVYKVKTSIANLFPGENLQDPNKRWPVDCIIQLTESLIHPNIDFKIEFPTADEERKDDFSRTMPTKEDVNRQMISLLMLGNFYTPEFFTGKATTETGTQLVGTTASELISNQLSNWLSQINDEWNVGVNYRPGNDTINDQVELALSTQILNNRVILDGNIANKSNTNTKNSSEIIGDFDIKVKLTNDGRFLFKVFNHSNDDLLYDNARYTQGVGFTYREDFNTLKELFRQYRDAILKKKKSKDDKEKLKNKPD